eukprot:TRINITY_DN120687_c0_g1_i1.p1 TRINITY_DN120687_c0_g1~~TRINITY_DN120687_c0_g1_i1.p1  ORF type:complete len:674 (+),score=45.95 TRINITY_DN120687_c0_g1_i1:927-2948(+)
MNKEMKQEWIAFVSLVGVYMCSAFYRDTLPKSKDTENAEGKLAIEIRVSNKSRRKTRRRIQEEAKVVSVEEGGTRKPWESIKGVIVNAWKLSTSTPFGLMHIVRGYLILWALKYNSILSLFIIFWLYYSISYNSTKRFCAFTPYLLLPAMGLQIVGTKFAEIPHLISPTSSYLPYFHTFGLFTYSFDSRINPIGEYIWTLIGFILVCATLKLMQYLPEYEKWAKGVEENAKRLNQKPNSLEITIRFLLEHTEKLYIVVLYIVAFNKLNVTHTLILLFFFLFVLLQKYARKYFVIIIFILLYRALLRYGILIGDLLGAAYSDITLKVFAILGIDIEYNPDVTVYKLDVDWELIIMFFCSYLQLKIIRYITAQPSISDQVDPSSGYIKFISYLNDIVQTYLLWIIYLVLFLVLAYQRISLFVQLYSMFVVALIFVHTLADLFDPNHKGYLRTKFIWMSLSLYNILVLLASYTFCFAVYTCGLETSIQESEEKVHIVKLIGLDFVRPTGMQLQLNFLPQFVVLYLAFIARQNIWEQDHYEHEKYIKYTKKFWGWCIDFMDIFSRYSFHMLFFAVAMLGVFWSLNFLMMVYLSIFAIHYCTLHLRYLRSQKSGADFAGTFQEKRNIIENESEIQSYQAIQQRRRTLKFVAILTAVALFLCQGFRFIHICKEQVIFSL